MPRIGKSINTIMPRKGSGETMLLKPCTNDPNRSIEKTSETMLLKPYDTIPKNSSKKRRVKSREVQLEEEEETEAEVDKGKRMILKPCDTSPKNSSKKRHVKSREVEQEEEEVVELVDKVPKFKEGDHVDLKALLSSKYRNFLVSPKTNDKVPISTLDGKYVLVCCFFVPHDKDGPEVTACRSIEALYSQLSLQGIADNVKLVVVIKTKTVTDSSVADFDRFFSKLSVDCLAIPFFDFESRDNVSESVYPWPLELFRIVPCLAVHPDGKVLQLDRFFLHDYGAQSFPFTEEHFDSILQEDEKIKIRLCSTDSPISLKELLQCDTLSQIGDENRSIRTSDLEGTPVGLYLCYNGYKDGFMVDLQDIYQKCLDKGHRFEIVLVPLPFRRHHDPESFYKRVKRYALKDSRSSSWWAFPFNEKICRTLWRIFHCCFGDELIILPHSGHIGDLMGRQVASFYGIDAYPFTRDVIFQRKFRHLRSLTLGQLLGDAFTPDLHNKNVIVCIDNPTCFFEDDSFYRNLNDVERMIQVIYPDVEVVFVPIEPVLSASKRELFKLGWHLLPGEACDSVIKHIFMTEVYPDEFVRPTIATFDKDGKILSRTAYTRLPRQFNSPAILFDDRLEVEILNEIKNYMH